MAKPQTGTRPPGPNVSLRMDITLKTLVDAAVKRYGVTRIEWIEDACRAKLDIETGQRVQDHYDTHNAGEKDVT